MPSASSIFFVSASISIIPVSTADTSGTKSMRRSRSSSWSFSEIPRTGPFWIRAIKCCGQQKGASTRSSRQPHIKTATSSPRIWQRKDTLEPRIHWRVPQSHKSLHGIPLVRRAHLLRLPSTQCAVHSAPHSSKLACHSRRATHPEHTVTNPAILLRRRLDGIMATSSQMRLLVWKSSVSRE